MRKASPPADSQEYQIGNDGFLHLPHDTPETLQHETGGNEVLMPVLAEVIAQGNLVVAARACGDPLKLFISHLTHTIIPHATRPFLHDPEF